MRRLALTFGDYLRDGRSDTGGQFWLAADDSASARRICKGPNGEDWELGKGTYGRVVKGVRGDVQVL